MSDVTGSFRAALPPLGNIQDGLRPTNIQPGSSDFETQARQQAEEFEASFLAALLQPVFEGLAKDATFGGGFAEETWTGLLTQEYARSIAQSSDLGISDHVYRQIVDLQEQADAEAPGSSLPPLNPYETSGSQ